MEALRRTRRTPDTPGLMDPRYATCAIYRIYVRPGVFYFGHTIDMNDRRLKHRAALRACANGKRSTPLYHAMLHEGFTPQDIVLEVVEAYPCGSKAAACAREDEWVDAHGCRELNVNRPRGLDNREYARRQYEQHRERRLAQIRARYYRQRPEILARQRARREAARAAASAA